MAQKGVWWLNRGCGCSLVARKTVKVQSRAKKYKAKNGNIKFFKSHLNSAKQFNHYEERNQLAGSRRFLKNPNIIQKEIGFTAKIFGGSWFESYSLKAFQKTVEPISFFKSHLSAHLSFKNYF